jgi:hypothetical protein
MLFSAANFKKMEGTVRDCDALVTDIVEIVNDFKQKNFLGMVVSIAKFIADLTGRIKEFKDRQSANLLALNDPKYVKKQV